MTLKEFKDKGHKTIIHEVGHFLTYYLLTKNMKGFCGLFVGNDVYGGFALIDDFWELTDFQQSCVEIGGAIAVKVSQNSKKLFFHGDDKERFLFRGHTPTETRKIKRKVEEMLTENKDLLLFVSDTIRKECHFKDYIKGCEITPERMKEILTNYCQTRDVPIMEGLEINPGAKDLMSKIKAEKISASKEEIEKLKAYEDVPAF